MSDAVSRGDAAFDARDLESKYAILANLPVSLFGPVVTHPHGTLESRVAGVLAWREALLEGRLPALGQTVWPDARISEALTSELTSLGISRFCAGQDDLVDSLLLDILRSVEEYQTKLSVALEENFEELKRLEQIRRQKADSRGRVASSSREVRDRAKGADRDSSVGDGARDGGPRDMEGPSPSDNKPTELDEAILRELAAAALVRVQELGLEQDPARALTRKWEEQVRIWSEISEVFGTLGELLGRGWDLSRSVLQSTGWLEVVRLRKLLEELPPLREVIKALGRLQATASPGEEASVAEQVFTPVRRAMDEWKEVLSPLAPMETRGVQRSDEISRMLPSEAVMLVHPTLRYLWHARRAERALLTYRVEGVLSERVTSEDEAMGGTRTEIRRRVLDRGPILVCLDTSGSMHGLPETVAKALVLEACRVSFQEKRPCHIYSFSGPDDVAEMTLSLSREGLAGIIAFLNYSFHGGTDVGGPLKRAVKRLEDGQWKRADVLIVSDGEFSVPDGLVASLAVARTKHGLRVHGVQIGSSYREEFQRICDHLHSFSDWEALLEGPSQLRTST